jgi:hypothetical protein
MALQSNADLRLLNGYHILGFLTVDFSRVGSLAPRPTPNLEDQVSIFISPGDRVAQLYPQAMSTHFNRLLRHAWSWINRKPAFIRNILWFQEHRIWNSVKLRLMNGKEAI